MKVAILAVSIGTPALLARVNGEDVFSSIAKQRVQLPSLSVGRESIEGDRQSDLRVHGGPDKAIYAYSAGHWPWWQTEHGLSCGPNTFGENLSIAGAEEDSIFVGDQFRWGTVLLEVSQPRAPCFKLGLHARDDIPARMTISARCGWYFRVLAPGSAPVDGTMERVASGDGQSIATTFRAALHPRIPPDVRNRALATEKLAPAWTRMIQAAAGR